MSEYYAVTREGDDDHLEHLFGFGSRKGSQKANHKYVARVQVGNGWKYFYSTAELAAYKAGKTVGGAAKTVGNVALKKNPIGKAIDKKFSISRDAKIAKRNAESKKKFLERAEYNRKRDGSLAEAHTNEFLNKPKRIERRTREATGDSPNLRSGNSYYDAMAQNKGWRNLNRDGSDNAPWRKAHNNYSVRKAPGSSKPVSKDHAKNAKALSNFLNASREEDRAVSSRKTKSNPLAGAASKASKAVSGASKAAGNAAKGAVSGASKAAGNAANTASKVLDRAKKANPIKVTTGEEARKANEKMRKDRQKMFNSSDYETSTKKFGPITIRTTKKKKKK